MKRVGGEVRGIATFLRTALRLKRTARKGWVAKLGTSHPESVAEHTFGVIILSYLLAKLRGYNAERAAVLALLHDLHEALTGDRIPEEGGGGEEVAIVKMVKPLPTSLRRQLLALWREAGTLRSPEARLVNEVDKLEMAAQALLYEEEGWSSNLLQGFWASASRALKSSAMKRLYRELEAERPSRRVKARV